MQQMPISDDIYKQNVSQPLLGTSSGYQSVFIKCKIDKKQGETKKSYRKQTNNKTMNSLYKTL